MIVFGQKIRKLRLERGELQSETAPALGLKPQSYSAYENGREPSYEILCKMAGYFGVTTDYLLGRTEVRSPDIHEQAISTQTGLSDDAIKALKQFPRPNEGGLSGEVTEMEVLNAILSSRDFSTSIAALARAIRIRPQPQDTPADVCRLREDFSQILEGGGEIVSKQEYAQISLERAKRHLSQLLETLYEAWDAVFARQTKTPR